MLYLVLGYLQHVYEGLPHPRVDDPLPLVTLPYRSVAAIIQWSMEYGTYIHYSTLARRLSVNVHAITSTVSIRTDTLARL